MTTGSGATPRDETDATEPPPGPPHELEPDPQDSRSFMFDGALWIARVAGKGAGGTGSYGLGMIDAVHFYSADDPETPRFEALVARGRFEFMYDEELIKLRAQGVAIPARGEGAD